MDRTSFEDSSAALPTHPFEAWWWKSGQHEEFSSFVCLFVQRSASSCSCEFVRLLSSVLIETCSKLAPKTFVPNNLIIIIVDGASWNFVLCIILSDCNLHCCTRTLMLPNYLHSSSVRYVYRKYWKFSNALKITNFSNCHCSSALGTSHLATSRSVSVLDHRAHRKRTGTRKFLIANSFVDTSLKFSRDELEFFFFRMKLHLAHLTRAAERAKDI